MLCENRLRRPGRHNWLRNSSSILPFRKFTFWIFPRSSKFVVHMPHNRWATQKFFLLRLKSTQINMCGVCVCDATLQHIKAARKWKLMWSSLKHWFLLHCASTTVSLPLCLSLFSFIHLFHLYYYLSYFIDQIPQNNKII